MTLNTEEDLVVAFSIQHFSVSALFLRVCNWMKGWEIKYKKVEVFAIVLLLLHFNSYHNEWPVSGLWIETSVPAED